MAGLALLASAGALLAAFGATGEVGVRTEVRARTPATASAAGSAAGPAVLTEVEIDPRGALRFGNRSSSMTLSYEPRLLFSEVTSAPGVNLMNNLRVRADLQASPALSLFATEVASYGRADFTSLTAPTQTAQTSGATQPAPQTLPIGRLMYLSTSTAAGVEARLARDLRGELQLGYQISGGADGASRPSLPLQRGPYASAGLTLTLSRLDSLATQLSLIQSEFTSEPRPNFPAGGWALVATASEGWRHSLSRTAELWLGAGIGLARTARALPSNTVPMPIGEAGIRLRPTSRVQTSVFARASPFLDRLTGNAYERADAMAEVSVAANPHLTISGRGSFGGAVGGAQRGDYSGGLDLGGGYAIGRAWQLTLGARALWQRVQGASLMQWAAFAGAQFAFTERL